VTPTSVKLTWMKTGQTRSSLILYRKKTAIDDEFKEIPSLTANSYKGEVEN
jgi:hypothetical protein